MSSHCLNCDSSLAGRFCSNCGQRADTHRFSLKHLITHDVAHGIWHVDRGILFTLRELVLRPGHAVREFVAGKRSQHFHFFTLTLLLLTVSHYLDNMSSVRLADVINAPHRQSVNAAEDIFRHYARAIALGSIPLYALASLVMFRKSRQNFAEHIVLNAYKGAGELIISMLYPLATLFCSDKAVLAGMFNLMGLLLLGYGSWFYAQYFSAFGYSRSGLVIRSVGTVICGYVLAFILTMLGAKLLVH